ncbi:branched-chain amino acid aminotransferase [Marininema mesophilum]|uniref:Branched-chain amino acid aminotransferase n=2 Tax=Marininema mesophilum TaxID=1048340 RepID=A0A1H3BD59_9BACL|nr:branched-chain amino acid aminotransferase [Marininema mesophilum]
MKTMFVVNGKLVSMKQATLSLMDRGARFGDGLFETLRVEKGVPLFLEAHLTRMEEGAKHLYFAKIPRHEEWIEGIKGVIEANRVTAGYLRLNLTRGQGGFGVPLLSLSDPVWWVEAHHHILDPKRYDQGIRAITVSIRKNPLPPLSRVKSLNYLESILAREEAVIEGAEEGIMLTPEGKLCEGASANIFLIKRGALHTPSLASGPLPGTVRTWVIQQAMDLGIHVEIREIDPEEWHEAEEAFFTNSTWGPFPCVQIGEQILADGKPGWMTRTFMDAWKKAVEEEIQSSPL